MSIRLQLKIHVKNAGRPVIQNYELPEHRILYLTYGGNIPTVPGQEAEDICALVENRGSVDYFPLSALSSDSSRNAADPELNISLPRTIICRDVTIEIRRSSEFRRTRSGRGGSNY